MKGESLSLISVFRSFCVSLSRNLFPSSFMERTFFSMLLSSRTWFRWRKVSVAD